MDSFFAPYIGTNIVALALLGVAFWRPQVARWAFVLVFVAASITNTATVLGRPEVYVDGYGRIALFEIYRTFIYGFFARHTSVIVVTIAVAQLLAGLLMMRRDERSRDIGAGLAGFFLLAIAPLGVGSAFPASLIMGLGLLVARRREVRTAQAHRYLAPPVSAPRPAVPGLSRRGREDQPL